MEALILFPAIDLKNGQCVRLEQGDMARATVFNLDPAAQARSFVAQGFEYLHVVDLDGAFAGKPMNAQAVEAMLKAVTIPLQLGGGIRDLGIAQRFEDAGVAAIIFTDISRDGLLKGLNLDATVALAERISIPVIASGGLASVEDVKALLSSRAKKLAGAIAGRALYDGRLDPAAALALIRGARAPL